MVSTIARSRLFLEHKFDRLIYRFGSPFWLFMRQMCKFDRERSLFRTLFSRTTADVSLAPLTSPLLHETPAVAQVVNALEADGLWAGFQLTPETVDEIYDFALKTPCYGDRQKNLGFYYSQHQQLEDYLGSVIQIGHYYNVPLGCAAVRKLEQDPVLLAIAAHYLQGQPVHQGSQLWWNFAHTSDLQPKQGTLSNLFHYDLDDSHSIKFFFYLTEVDDQAGPHVCVPGSHRHKSRLIKQKRRRLSDAEVFRHYGHDCARTLTGKAGYGFVEDIFCVHKGGKVETRDRLILTIQFALRNYHKQSSIVDESQLSMAW